MKRVFTLSAIAASLLMISACGDHDTSETRDREAVQAQQDQYAKGQPIPAYDWSLERDLVIQLYNIRNQRVATHSVWRSDHGMIEGDCPSMGYGLPYDTSLTNPLMATRIGEEHPREMAWSGWTSSLTSIGQAEPNGVFASTNTSATWVMCVGPGGVIEPHYVESKVTVYPGPVEVDYKNNRVVRTGRASVTMRNNQP